MPDVTTQTTLGFPYVSKNYHRNGNRNKSQWKSSVTIKVEVEIFLTGHKQGQSHAWGHYLNGDTVTVLGTSPSSTQPVVELLVAKFNGQQNPQVWSGYPADYRRNPQDRPPVSVLNEWVTAGVIAKHEISRVRGGKKCTLSK